MLKSPPPKISAHKDMSDHEHSHVRECPGAIANGLTDVKTASVKCLFIFNCS
jgi:hypothetical protein